MKRKINDGAPGGSGNFKADPTSKGFSMHFKHALEKMDEALTKGDYSNFLSYLGFFKKAPDLSILLKERKQNNTLSSLASQKSLPAIFDLFKTWAQKISSIEDVETNKAQLVTDIYGFSILLPFDLQEQVKLSDSDMSPAKNRSGNLAPPGAPQRKTRRLAPQAPPLLQAPAALLPAAPAAAGGAAIQLPLPPQVARCLDLS